MVVSKKVKEVYRYRPKRIGVSDKYWCNICYRDYPRNHLHFDFSSQKVLQNFQPTEKKGEKGEK